MFKKGQQIVRIASCDRAGTVCAECYIVASWGKKQATLIRQDGSNAEFRVYTQDASIQQGTNSILYVLASDYSDAVAQKFAEECVAEGIRRIERRWAHAQERARQPFHIPYAGTIAQELEFEQGVFQRGLAEIVGDRKSVV